MKLKRFVFFLLMVNVYSSVTAQVGKITYLRTVNIQNISQKLPFLSAVDKDRLTINKNWGYSNSPSIYLLYFQKDLSQYKLQSKPENYDDDKKDIFTSDFSRKTVKDIRVLPDAKYLVEDHLTKYSWKILNELKDVAGYVCMKAQTRDTVNNVLVNAWFTDKIPYSSGPEGYHGLPGMILLLEFNQDDVVIEATKVEWMPEDFVVPEIKKMKGKKVNHQKFNALKKQYIQNYLDKKHNPYWWIRY